MILIPRQEPLLTLNGYSYPKCPDGMQRMELPVIECGGLQIRGDYQLETPDGMRAVRQIQPGEYILFYPEPIRGYGPGMLVRSGDTMRAMSQAEAWGLGVGWLTPDNWSLSHLARLTDRQPEAAQAMQFTGTMLSGAHSAFYDGLARLNTFQLKALIRGCLWAVSTWEQGWEEFTPESRYHLRSRFSSAPGRFLAQLGLVLSSGHKLDTRMSSSLDARLQDSELLVIPYDVSMLRVTAAGSCRVRTVVMREGIRARVLGLEIKGLDFARPAITRI